MKCKDCINEKFCGEQCSSYFDHLSEECMVFCHNSVCEYKISKAEKCKGFKPKDRFVEIKQGEWKEDELLDDIICPFCCQSWSIISNDVHRFNYCPNCGARMKESELKVER